VEGFYFFYSAGGTTRGGPKGSETNHEFPPVGTGLGPFFVIFFFSDHAPSTLRSGFDERGRSTLLARRRCLPRGGRPRVFSWSMGGADPQRRGTVGDEERFETGRWRACAQIESAYHGFDAREFVPNGMCVRKHAEAADDRAGWRFDLSSLTVVVNGGPHMPWFDVGCASSMVCRPGRMEYYVTSRGRAGP